MHIHQVTAMVSLQINVRLKWFGKATLTPDRTIYWSYDWLRFGERATDRQCLLRSPKAVAYCDRSFLLLVGHRTIGRTRGRAINNDWRRSIATSIVGNRTTSGSHKRSIVWSIVAPDDRSYDQSWNSATDSVTRRMGSDLNPGNISTYYSVNEQSIGGTTGRKVANPVVRLIVRPLTIWNTCSRFQVLSMTIDLVATDLPLAITRDLCDQSYDLCDQSYVLSTICPRLHYFSIAGRS